MTRSISVSSRKWTEVVWFIASVLLLAALALATNRLAAHSPKALEYPLWAAVLGLIANGIASGLKIKPKLGTAFRTELFLKVGLVLLGASVNITEILSVGARGVVQAVVLVVSVFLFTWWLGGALHLEKKLRAVMCAAVSICGVSAAIAAGGSILARKEHLAYVTALVIITALPMMILMPWIAALMGMSPEWAGAWFGGNIDTTAAVVGAGAIYGEAAVRVASIVKMAQNALIGVMAFLLALYWVTQEEQTEIGRPSARVLWDRFPKFVLGFILVSVLASAGAFTKAQIKDITALRHWAFTLAFVGIGWDLALGEFRRIGFRPLAVYLAATVFNTLLALGASWLLFGQ
ncbi:MAG: putative sulfate exporter family transporter [Anaerolineae bacterium]|nr:YeiH family protein [Anaerolineae bacterium]MDW8068770.1 putative sulfate exporter family transporter [Anaerolineae bacterium]